MARVYIAAWLAAFFLVLSIDGLAQSSDSRSAKYYQWGVDSVKATISENFCADQSPVRICYQLPKSSCMTEIGQKYDACAKSQGGKPLDKDNFQAFTSAITRCVAGKVKVEIDTRFIGSASCRASIDQAVSKPPGRQTAGESAVSKAFNSYMAEQDALAAKLSKSFRDSPKSFCPGYTANDRIGCLKQYVRTQEIGSTIHLLGLLQLPLQAENADIQSGLAKTMCNLKMIDATLAIWEKVDLKKFKITNLQASNVDEKSELERFKNLEEIALADAARRDYDLFDSLLARVWVSHDVPPVSIFKLSQYPLLKRRLDQLRAKTWHFEKN